MSAQGVSRKRPAPGSIPVTQQQLQSLPEYATTPPQLSNEQFLRWGQNPQPNAATSYPEPSNHNSNNYGTSQTNVIPSNQLTRRSGNQLVSRGRPYNDAGGTWGGPDVGPSDQVEGSWSEKDEDLEQKALLAKRDAMAKRKQIPPFVQKLAR
jgi:heat shock transcription factor, other eukaryote